MGGKLEGRVDGTILMSGQHCYMLPSCQAVIQLCPSLAYLSPFLSPVAWGSSRICPPPLAHGAVEPIFPPMMTSPVPLVPHQTPFVSPLRKSPYHRRYLATCRCKARLIRERDRERVGERKKGNFAKEYIDCSPWEKPTKDLAGRGERELKIDDISSRLYKLFG